MPTQNAIVITIARAASGRILRKTNSLTGDLSWSVLRWLADGINHKTSTDAPLLGCNRNPISCWSDSKTGFR